MAEKRVFLRDGYLNIRFDYDRDLVRLVRGLPERRWDKRSRTWLVPSKYVGTVVDLLRDAGFSFDEATLELYREARSSPQNLTVSQLNLMARNALHTAFPEPVWLVGKILNFDKNAHKDVVDFRLVEESEGGAIVAEVQAVLFPEARSLIERKLELAGNPFELGDEVEVRVLAQVELKVDWGEYRVVVQDLDVAYTLGEVARRREEIVRKLAAEGLLELNRSLPFPPLPLRVGLITSLGSDAENDVLKTLRESGFAFRVTVHGARVQGPYTEPSVLNALDWFRERADEFDVILICRGGGSRTDLAWFDSEALGRAVATFPLPVVVGIGHEQDFSVLDHVAWRAKTPTAAAQLLVQRVRETLQFMEEVLEGILKGAESRLNEESSSQREREARLIRAVGFALSRAEADLERLSRALPRAVGMALGKEESYLDGVRARLSRAALRGVEEGRRRSRELFARIRRAAHAYLEREVGRLSERERRLSALDPRRVVERGFAILRGPNGKAITAPAQAPAGTEVTAELRGGVLRLISKGGDGGRRCP